jgi:ribosome-associated translation inhibitor RaiA
MDTLPPPNSHERWKFLRDVGVFQFKLALNNLHNFVQIPVTLAIAAVDLVFKGESEGSRFYKFLEMGRGIDDSIDIYSVIAHRERSLNREYTVDAVLKRLEDVVVREYEKGGTAASVKTALDKAIDEMQTKANLGKERAADVVKTAAEKLREKMDAK